MVSVPQRAGLKAYGLVRDRQGRARIDRPERLHPAQIFMLTADERREHGIWEGPMALDAEGKKRLTKDGDVYRAEDPIVALQAIFDDEHPKGRRSAQRVDVPAGGTIGVN